ncbi:hypothetical protein FB45DRAFT_40616 [Roridomyces roridus]|uniref:F-box domain-containing protein n=1 Tax=Roridomyces roridus TaxID=1738132 RepID=A0AAD7BRK8_9AGAR|nr:hypothetical protein FB45DRAFT_40616 [Roridomyces roridus]
MNVALALPIELVTAIIDYALAAQDSLTNKASWDSVSPLSLASKIYRTLVLEAWFRVLLTKDPADVSFIASKFREIRSSWTRELFCKPQLLDGSQDLEVWDLTGFRRLHTVRVDCKSCSLARQFPFRSVPLSITELELLDVYWPSPFVMQGVADIFPALRTLKLRLPRIWCGLCNTCSSVRFAEPVPPKLVYSEGLGLPIHYARAMSHMQHLRTVHITVSYSSGTQIQFNANNPTEDLWSGECDRCVELLYGDKDFHDRWTARKKGIDSAGGKGERLYIKPPALATVEWTFLKNEVDETSDEEQEDYDDEE